MYKAPREAPKKTRLTVIDTKTDTYKGFDGKECVAVFKAEEPVSKAFLEVFRRDPKATLDELEKDALEPRAEPTDESEYIQVGKLMEVFSKTSPVTWEKLDKQPINIIHQNVMGCLMSGRLSLAMLGLSYLVYQDKIAFTNKAEALIKDPASAYTQPEPPDAA